MSHQKIHHQHLGRRRRKITHSTASLADVPDPSLLQLSANHLLPDISTFARLVAGFMHRREVSLGSTEKTIGDVGGLRQVTATVGSGIAHESSRWVAESLLRGGAGKGAKNWLIKSCHEKTSETL